MFNKNDFRKTRDKKVLRKVGKQWKVVSIALLIAISGGAAVATNANASSVNSATQNEVNELEKKPAVTSTVSASTNQSSTASASMSASASSSNYLNTDGGSAASYHDNAVSAGRVKNSNADIMAPYVNSLNSNFSTHVSALSGWVESANLEASNYQSLAVSYSTVANSSATSSAVSENASKAGMTPEMFMNSVQDNVSDNTSLVNSASVASQAIKMFYSLGYQLYTNNWDDVSASDYNRYRLTNTKSVINSNELSVASKVFSQAVSASVANQFALENNSAAYYQASNAEYSAESNSSLRSLNQSVMASANKGVLSAKAAQASYAQGVNINHQALVSLTYQSGNYSIANYLNRNNAAMTRNFASYAHITWGNGIAVGAAKIMYDLSHGYSTLAHFLFLASASDGDSGFSNENNDVAGNLATLNSVAIDNNIDAGYIAKNADEFRSVATDINDHIRYGNTSAAVSTVASSVNSAYVKSFNASNSYAKSTDANVTLASYFASSYAADANSASFNAIELSHLKDQFYLRHSDVRFSLAASAYHQASSEQDANATLANAYGRRVYNYSPKYVTVSRNGLLHSNPEFTNDNVITKVPENAALSVLGVGFAKNGLVRYLVNYRGRTGYFTSNDNYVRSTYELSKNNNQVSVKFLRNAKVYAMPNSKRYLGKTVTAGTVLQNVKVVGLDNTYGGFTNLETADGHFITANTDYIRINGNQGTNTPIITFK